jgi:hypothetical protein
MHLSKMHEYSAMPELLVWCALASMLAVSGVVTAWMAGAIYYDVFRSAKWSRVVVAGWVISVIALFSILSPLWQPFLLLIATLMVFLVWWFRLRPRHDREWEPSVAMLPRAASNGDAITIESVRNFEYRSLDDFTPRYERRTYRLTNLKRADVVFFNWGIALMSHPVVVFDFGPDGRVCLSIEVRFRRGQQFSIIRSLYRQQELIFLVGDERDIILRRTKYGSPQEAHMYRLNVTLEELRASFLDYINAVNQLHERPRWYHGLTANCTTSFYRLPNSRRRRDWRVLANGRLDRALYEDGRLDRSLSFQELKRISYLNDVANAAPEAGFGDYILRELERRRNGR